MSGASRKNEKWEHSEGETVSVEGKSEAEKLATDPMYRLEHNVGDKRKAEDEAPRIARIMVSLSNHVCCYVSKYYCVTMVLFINLALILSSILL